jgi:hypothetical protein
LPAAPTGIFLANIVANGKRFEHAASGRAAKTAWQLASIIAERARRRAARGVTHMSQRKMSALIVLPLFVGRLRHGA